MLACLDVAYLPNDEAKAACVLFPDWPAPESSHLVEQVQGVAPYVPGQFYRRELPCLLAVLAKAGPVEAVVIDGYVWLPGHQSGLGAHLYQALQEKIPIVGVAKTSFQGSPHAEKVYRGQSQNPLFVTAAGMSATDAARHVQSMHGAFRLPSVLKAVDSYSRQ